MNPCMPPHVNLRRVITDPHFVRRPIAHCPRVLRAAMTPADGLAFCAAAFIPCACIPRPCPRDALIVRGRPARRRARTRMATAPASGTSLPSPDAADPSVHGVPAGEGGGVEGGSGSALLRFTRPHTMRGTILGAVAGCLRALLEHRERIEFSLVPRAGLGLWALLLGNAFIVGVNQVFDVSIDRVNKPFLPIASGEMSPALAWMLVLASGALGLFIVHRFFSRLIFALYAFGMLIGGLYSVPPFRFKRFPVLAALTISCVRGFLMNFGVYHATTSALGVAFKWSPPISFLAVFMTVFACVIAIAKDLPDIKGDTAAGVATFASKRGTASVVRLVVAMLGVNYAGAVVTAFVAPPGAFRRPVLAIGHAVLGFCLYRHARDINPEEQGSIKRFYAFIWTLFYAEYLLFPFI